MNASILAILLGSISAAFVHAGSLGDFLNSEKERSETIMVDGSGYGCAPSKFKKVEKNGHMDILYLEEADGLSIRRCQDAVDGKSSFKRGHLSADTILANDYAQLAKSIFYGKELAQVSPETICKVKNFVKACSDNRLFDVQNWNNSDKISKKVSDYVSEAKQARYVLEKALPRLQEEIDEWNEKEKRVNAIWSKEGCENQPGNSPLVILESTAGNPCGLSSKITDMRVSEIEVTGEAGTVPSINLEGKSVKEGMIEVREHVRKETANKPVGIVSVVLKSNQPEEIAEITLWIEPMGSDLEQDTFVTQIERRFCGADASNSLNSASTFRKAMQSIYGVPAVQKSGKILAQSLAVEKNNKVAALKRQSPAPELEAFHQQVISTVEMGYQSQIDHFKSLGDQVARLEWKDGAGNNLSIEDYPNQCPVGKSFSMVLVSGKSLAWVEQARKKQAAGMEQKAKNAAVPKF